MSKKEKQLLKESWLEMLGSWNKFLLKQMYGDTKQVATLSGPDTSWIKESEGEEETGGNRQFVIRGKYQDVKAWAGALSKEKEYIDTYVEYGADHPTTTKARVRLEDAIQNFESTTRLTWPFKDEE